MRRQSRELTIRHAISRSTDFSVDRIGPEIHETDTIIQKLLRRDQRVVWRNSLRSVLHIKIGPEYYFVAIAIERRMKRRITIVGRAKNHVEHDKSRAGPEQPVKQKRPHFTRPGERPLCHQLDRKSTRLNSSHVEISYAVFCLKKKKSRAHAVEI